MGACVVSNQIQDKNNQPKGTNEIKRNVYKQNYRQDYNKPEKTTRPLLQTVQIKQHNTAVELVQNGKLLEEQFNLIILDKMKIDQNDNMQSYCSSVRLQFQDFQRMQNFQEKNQNIKFIKQTATTDTSNKESNVYQNKCNISSFARIYIPLQQVPIQLPYL